MADIGSVRIFTSVRCFAVQHGETDDIARTISIFLAMGKSPILTTDAF